LRNLGGRYVRGRLAFSIAAFCAVIVIVLWTGLAYQLRHERDLLIGAREAENDNLARLFEEHVLRTLAAAGVMLRELESEYRRAGTHLDLAKTLRDRQLELEPYLMLSVVNDKGDVVLLSTPMTRPQNVLNLENAQFHVHNTTLDIYISKPRYGVTTGKATVYVTRRMNKPDGSFGGNTTVGMNPEYFSGFYEQIDLGRDSVVALIGTDGVVRARRSNESSRVGQDVSETPLFTAQLPRQAHGRYQGVARVDGVARLYSYRIVKGYPLVVLVGTSKDVLLGSFERRRNAYLASAGVLSVLVLGFGALLLAQITRQAQITEKLRGQTQRLQLGQSAAGLIVMDWDIRNDEISWSDSPVWLRGPLPPGRGRYPLYRDQVHTDDREAFLAMRARSIETLQGERMEYRVVRTDGELRWVDSHHIVFAGHDGKAQRMLVALHDITERKKAEAELARLAAIVEGSEDAIVARTLDLKVVTWNAAAERMFGYKPHEVIGKDIEFLIPPDRQAETEMMRTLLDQGRRVAAYDSVRLAKDGRRIEVSTTQSPIKDASGRTVGIALTYRDVSERRRAEEALRQSEERLRQSVSVADIGVFDHDLVADTIYWSPVQRKIYGIGPDEVITLQVYLDHVYGEDLEGIRAAVRHTRDPTGDGVFDMDHRILRNDGAVRWIRARASTFFEGKGAERRPVRTVGAVMDVTDKVRIGQELRELNATLEQRVAERTAELESINRDLGSFSYSISHDLRAPVRAMNGYARILLEDFGPNLPKDAQRLLHRIADAGTTMGAMIAGLLELFRVQQRQLQRVPVDLTALARAVWTDLAAAEPGAPYTLHVEPGLSANGDPVLLRNLLLNLLGNARKYSSNRLERTVWVGKEPAGACFVRDNGEGFDMRFAEKLFSPFGRLHNREEFEGHGIGLAVAQKIVARHGGRIWADAKPDKGATFFFTLG
jgi:PAS domain S-box-containing protein